MKHEHAKPDSRNKLLFTQKLVMRLLDQLYTQFIFLNYLLKYLCVSNTIQISQFLFKKMQQYSICFRLIIIPFMQCIETLGIFKCVRIQCSL